MSTKDQQITQLMEMGFGNNRVVRALQATAFKVVLFRSSTFLNVFEFGNHPKRIFNTFELANLRLIPELETWSPKHIT